MNQGVLLKAGSCLLFSKPIQRSGIKTDGTSPLPWLEEDSVFLSSQIHHDPGWGCVNALPGCLPLSTAPRPPIPWLLTETSPLEVF